MNGNDELHKLVNSIALKNAAEHSGRTNVNTVLAKILSLKPEMKTEIKTLIQLPHGISAGMYVGKFTDADGDVSVVKVIVSEP